jgi:hypothetical protein
MGEAMGTTMYFEKYVKNDFSEETIRIEVGTSSFAGNGPQMYLKLGDSEVLLSHEDAKELFAGMGGISSYFGNWKEPG